MTYTPKNIITALEYVKRWNLAQTVVKHTGNNVWRFTGKEIDSKFGVPKLLITGSGPKLVTNATKVHLANLEINQSVTTPYYPQFNGRP